MKTNIRIRKITPLISVTNTLVLLVIALAVSPYSYATAQDKDGLLKTVVLAPEASCISSSCHKGMGKKKFIHSIGVDGKKCVICHEIIREGEHIFKNIPLVAVTLCAKCHAEDDTASKEQAKELSGKKVLALEDILDKMPEVEVTKPEEENLEPVELKREPPKVISKNEGLILHLPFAEGKCTECHEVHESDFQTHLKADYPKENYSLYSDSTYNLCLKCHKEFEMVMTEPRMLAGTKFRNGNLNLHFRHINRTKGRTCNNCHHHHGTMQPKLIRESFPFGRKMLDIAYTQTQTGGSCATACHITVSYDRYEPVTNFIKTTSRIGNDATVEELSLSRDKEMSGDSDISETTNQDKGEEK